MMNVANWPLPVRVVAAFGLVVGLALEGVGAVLSMWVALANAAAPTPIPAVCWGAFATVLGLFYYHAACMLKVLLR